jgi:hypothetical protein
MDKVAQIYLDRCQLKKETFLLTWKLSVRNNTT